MKVLILGNIDKTKFLETINELIEVLKSHKVGIYVGEIEYNFLIQHRYENIDAIVSINNFTQLKNIDLIFSIGGDGTFLTTASFVKNSNIPIMGINIGRLGFLADVPSNSIKETIDEIMVSGYKTETRSLIQVFSSQYDFSPNCVALNEIAILKLDTSSMITIHATLNNEYLGTYQADGLIVSTPTGSTAYALSVGASILEPTNNSFIMAPVAPHSLNVRPFIFPDDWEVYLEVKSRNNSYLVSIDGHSHMLNETDTLTIKKAEYTMKIAKRYSDSYFKTLRNKLMWGADTRHQDESN